MEDILGKAWGGNDAYGISDSDEEEAFRTIREACGTDGYYHIGYYPDQSYSFVDTFDSLKTELNIKVDRDNSEVMNKIRAQITKTIKEDKLEMDVKKIVSQSKFAQVGFVVNDIEKAKSSLLCCLDVKYPYV